jgi:hypothetical protein
VHSPARPRGAFRANSSARFYLFLFLLSLIAVHVLRAT